MSLLKRIFSFQFIGWIGTGVNLAFLWFCYDVLEWSLLVSGALAIEAAIIHNFVWYYFWTWNDRVVYTFKDFFELLFKYNVLTAIIDFVVRLSILWVLTEYYGVHYIISDIAGMFVAPLFKYLANDSYVFNTEPTIYSRLFK